MTQAKTKHTRQRPDPLVAIGEEIGRLDAIFTRPDPPADGDFLARVRMREVDDRIDGLQEWATHHQARSLPGALIHLYLLENSFAKLEQAEFDTCEAQIARREAMRLWFSVVEVLRQHVNGVDPTGKRMYNPDGSPWLALSAATASVP